MKNDRKVFKLKLFKKNLLKESDLFDDNDDKSSGGVKSQNRLKSLSNF